jgi:hypothetical protein
MSYIDETYFKSNPIAIPDLEQSNGIGTISNNSSLDRLRRCIAINEPKYLRKLMGLDMYLEYVSDVDDAKWTPLLAKLVDTDLLRSPIANWVYIQYAAENYSKFTGIGSVKGKSDNSENTASFYNQILAWNDMAFQHEVILQWLYDNRADFEQINNFDMSTWESLCTQKSIAEGYFL